MRRLLVSICLACLFAGSALVAGETEAAARQYEKLSAEAAAVMKQSNPKPEDIRGLLVGFDRFAALYPKSSHAPDALYRRAILGITYISDKERIVCFRRIVDEYARSSLCEGSYFSLGQLYLDSGDARSARRAFCMMLSRYPSTRMRKTVHGMLNQINLIGKSPRPMELRDINGSIVKFPADGIPTVIGFWAAWCEPSVKQQELIGKLRAKFGPERLEILSICLDGDPQKVLSPFAKIDKSRRPRILASKGWDDPLAKEFRVVTVPATFVLDRHGVVRHVGTGGDGLWAAIHALLDAEAKQEPPKKGKPGTKKRGQPSRHDDNSPEAKPRD